jgi:hypothetical protein
VGPQEWLVRDNFGERWRLRVVRSLDAIPPPADDSNSYRYPISRLVYGAFDQFGARGEGDVARGLLEAYDELTGTSFSARVPNLANDRQRVLFHFNEHLQETLRREAAAGRLVVEHVEPLPWPFPDTPELPAPEPPLVPPVEEQEQPVWIGLELVDGQGKPLPHRRYCVTLPDGTVREGVLDDRGAATLWNIPPGTCGIECPAVTPGPTRTYVVGPGDHVPGIANRFGIEDFNSVWNDRSNAAIRARRKSPALLAPGDELVIPERTRTAASRPTGAMHRFVAKIAPLKLRVKLLDFLGRPITTALVSLSGLSDAITTNGDGAFEADIAPSDVDRDLSVDAMSFPVQIGFLDPIDEEQGWKARLLNLGYPLDPSDEADDDDVRLALEEFQADNGLPVTGRFDDVTRTTLEGVYGC